tara:strand:- start:432 stop:635 length:204 start_codon:yes stop_codon:yes gene_type:complete
MVKTVSAIKFAELIQKDILNTTGQELSVEFLIPRIEKIAILHDAPETPVDKYISDVLNKAKEIHVTS